MTTFRKKPVLIEAFQVSDKAIASPSKWPEWAKAARVSGTIRVCTDQGSYALIETLEGIMRAEVGDWIIRGIRGELYPCKPEIFEASYEQVGDHISSSEDSK